MQISSSYVRPVFKMICFYPNLILLQQIKMLIAVILKSTHDIHGLKGCFSFLHFLFIMWNRHCLLNDLPDGKHHFTCSTLVFEQMIVMARKHAFDNLEAYVRGTFSHNKEYITWVRSGHLKLESNLTKEFTITGKYSTTRRIIISSLRWCTIEKVCKFLA